MNPWRYYWLTLIVVGFGVPEAIALIRHRVPDTFSASWWKWLGTYGGRFNVQRRVIGGAFFAALFAHFEFGVHGWPWLIVPAVPLAVVVAVSTFIWRE